MSVTEEIELIPALRVYMNGCNFRCRFCDTAPECHASDTGRPIDAAACAAELRRALRTGVRTISVLGGEPTLHAHTLVELAAAADGPLSLALNTNLYATPEALALLDGVAGLYVVDLKFGQDECAQRLAGVPHYLDAIRRNLCWIARRTPFLVRHLLLPGHLECCLRPLANWLAAELPGCRFQLYTGFVPCWQAAAVGLGRLNTRAEARAAVEHLRALPLEWKSGCDGTT